MMKRFSIARSAVIKVVAGTSVALLLSGCAEGTLSDLRSFVESTNQRAAPAPEPLPPIKPYNVYTYTVVERDPFEPFFTEEPPEAGPGEDAGGVSPDFNRNKEELEQFPLDTLRMVGTLEREEDVWAVVLATDATLHRVQIGNHMGQNHGKIVNIQDDRVDLIEIARDARGRWQERPASIALVEPEE